MSGCWNTNNNKYDNKYDCREIICLIFDNWKFRIAHIPFPKACMREVQLQLETRPTDLGCSLPTYSPQPPSSFIIVNLPEWSENWYSFCRIVIYTVRAQASDKCYIPCAYFRIQWWLPCALHRDSGALAHSNHCINICTRRMTDWRNFLVSLSWTCEISFYPRNALRRSVRLCQVGIISKGMSRSSCFFWHGIDRDFLRPILHCVIRKFMYLEKIRVPPSGLS